MHCFCRFVARDGNCGYAAVLKSLDRQEEVSVLEYRKQLGRWIRENPEHTSVQLDSVFESVGTEAERVEKEGVWMRDNHLSFVAMFENRSIALLVANEGELYECRLFCAGSGAQYPLHRQDFVSMVHNNEELICLMLDPSERHFWALVKQ